MDAYQLSVNEAPPNLGTVYVTLDEAKAAGRVAIEPTAEEEEAPGSFIDLDSYFVVHRVASDNARDETAVYDSRWPA